MKKDNEDIYSKIEKAYCQHKQLMLAIAFNKLHDRGLAEDAVHNAMIKIIKYPGNIDFNDEIRVRNYFARVVRNVSIDMLMKNVPNTSLDTDPAIMLTADDNSNPEQYAVTNESVNGIIEEINKMDAKYSDVLKYLKKDKMSIAQTAEMMCISKRTVSYRLEAAIHILKERLRKADR